MAIDTLAKRRSAITPMSIWRGPPVADGTIDAGDRLAVGLLYSGIAASSAVDTDREFIFLHTCFRAPEFYHEHWRAPEFTHTSYRAPEFYHEVVSDE